MSQQTPEMVLQHWEGGGGVKVGNRYTYGGEGLIEVLAVRERGDFLNIDWRETVSGHRWSTTVRRPQ